MPKSYITKEQKDLSVLRAYIYRQHVKLKKSHSDVAITIGISRQSYERKLDLMSFRTSELLTVCNELGINYEFRL